MQYHFNSLRHHGDYADLYLISWLVLLLGGTNGGMGQGLGQLLLSNHDVGMSATGCWLSNWTVSSLL